MESKIEYSCKNCGGIFDTPSDVDASITCCPYCGNTAHLMITKLESAPCDISGTEDDVSFLTPEQEEMALYESAVMEMGIEEVTNRTILAMASLTKCLLETGIPSGKPECAATMPYPIYDLNEARAQVSISLNFLHILLGDNTEFEQIQLNDLESMIDSLPATIGTLTLEYEEANK